MKVQVGDIFKVKLPASEICMHMRLTDKLADVYFNNKNQVAVYVDGNPTPIHMLPSEAGIRFNNGEYDADLVE